jgi:tight adherence protein B
MVAALISLILALAAVLFIPAAALAIQKWAGALHRSRLRTLDQNFSDAFVFIEPRRYAWWLVFLVVGCAMLATALSGSGLLGFAAGAVALCVPALAARQLQRRRRLRVIAQLPDALDLLASSLRSGLALAPALAHLVEHQPPPLVQELALVVRQQRLGRSLDEALAVMCTRIGSAELVLFTTAVAVARVVGGNLSEILARLAQTLRDRQAIERKIVALTAQARMQARIAGLLPLALLLVMTRLEPRAMHLMFTTAQGRAALLVLAVLELAGAMWLMRQSRIDV